MKILQIINLFFKKRRYNRLKKRLMAYESTQIANYFIEQGIAEDTPVSPLKVLKLTYMAHGWYLGITGNPLIKETVQAWKYGPVIEELYHKLKRYGDRPITSLIREDNQICQVPPVDVEVLAFLKRIWDLYKKYTAMQLSSMSHAANTPWYATVEPYRSKGHFPMCLDIDNNVIQVHYKAKLQEMSSS
jgi:uncharacterized phage-associated protein